MLLPNVYIDGELWDYFVSRQGKVYSLNYKRTGKVKEKKPYITQNGYLMVNLYKNGKMKNILVSRLVAQAYIPNPNNLPEVDHINRNKLNNDVNNLRWVTASENNYNRNKIEYPKNIKGSKAVKCIETGEVFPSINEVKRQKGYSKSNICNCCRGKLKTAYGFHWEYV